MDHLRRDYGIVLLTTIIGNGSGAFECGGHYGVVDVNLWWM